MALAVKSAGLGGLKKAILVLQCLGKGRTRRQIVEPLGGDEELVDVWISFLMQYYWVEQHYWIEQQEEPDEWSVTPEGKERYEEITRTLHEN